MVKCYKMHWRADLVTYQEALDYIHSRTQFGIKLGLKRMRRLLELSGNPHQKFPVIHVAGTNGKGSVTAIITSVLASAGYKVGRFTSPHLSSYTERFSINNRDITEDRLGTLLSGLIRVLDKTAGDPCYGEPTEFEVGTLLALEYFAEEEVDIAVLEVGMGGRLDSTNVVNPLVCGITQIALDHREFLGGTLAEIAWEKAGIIKANRPVVTGVQEETAYSALKKVAAKVKAPFYSVGKDFSYQVLGVGADGTELELRQNPKGSAGPDGKVLSRPQSEEGNPVKTRLGLIGRHQAANAALAFGILSVIKEKGFYWEKSHLFSGFAGVRWPGRLEYFPGRPGILLDGAHNPHGCSALYQALMEVFSTVQIYLVMGILNNRPFREMVSILAPRITQAFTTRVPDPKSADPREIAAEFRNHGVEAVDCVEPRAALQQAFDVVARKENGLLLITGSLYLIGALRPEVLSLKRPVKPGGPLFVV